MHRGIEVGLHLQPGLTDESFVGTAIGNLAAYRLQRERGEPLVWQVIRIESTRNHHFRLVIRHPERVLDVGMRGDLERILNDLSDESVDELHVRYEAAQQAGLKPVPLRHLHEEVDFWTDDFWNWLG
ncbi:MAG: hypothetical protein WBF81_03470 [Thermoplasmata archaeon]